MSLVWDNFPRGGSDKLVMLAMADWCNDEGGSLHPSVATVARKVCVSDKQARVILHKLIDEGYLAVVGNENGGNPGASRQYTLNIKRLSTPPASVTPPAKVTPPVEVRYPSRGGSFTPPAHGSLTTIEPSITTSNKSAPATRLPADWKPSIDDLSFCKTKRPDLNPFDVADSFVDYWLAVPGAKGKKQDWPATWRNWIRNQRQAPTTTRGQTRHEQLADKLADLTGSSSRNQSSDPRVIHGTAERLD
jgi:hypothetical protein